MEVGSPVDRMVGVKDLGKVFEDCRVDWEGPGGRVVFVGEGFEETSQ